MFIALDETRKRISDGVDITFTRKASSELEDLTLIYDIIWIGGDINEKKNVTNPAIRNMPEIV